jgi:hypothetical protein
MVKLELSEQMIQVIGEALGNAPFKTSAPVIAELQKQINAQQDEAPAQSKQANGGQPIPPIAPQETL